MLAAQLTRPKALVVLATLFMVSATAKNKDMADKVDFQFFEIDAQVKDMLWCGNDNEVIVVQTVNGQIYRSRDKGENWKHLTTLMNKQGMEIADDDQRIGKIQHIQQSPVDDSLVVFIGTAGINWVTEDCGANIRALNTGKTIEEFNFHPTKRDWALAASWTQCDLQFSEDDTEPGCKLFKELYVTKSLGTEWTYLTNYVFDFEWGYTKKVPRNGEIVDKIPDERIFFTREPDGEKAHQRQAGTRSNWSSKINLYMSDDLLATAPKMKLEKGNTIVKTEAYMFVTKANMNEKFTHTYSSTFKSGFTSFVEVILPPNEKPVAHSFTILDSNEDTVFLFLENHGVKSPFGNIYVSDENAQYFALSLENVIKSKAVDFERVQSLDGTYIANIYDPTAEGGSSESIEMISYNEKGKFKKTKTITDDDENQTFKPADIQAEFEKQDDKGKMRGSMSTKQKETNNEVFRIPTSIAAGDVEKRVRTVITHNKGANWQPITAPTQTSKGKIIDCYEEDKCTLNLEIFSTDGNHAPVYSSESSVGVVIGTGNIGSTLTENFIDKALYISRDGGLTFKSTHAGNYIYDIGDHGALIIAAKMNEPTNVIEFTWDFGKTWDSVQFTEDEMIVKNIITEPKSNSQQFIVYGTFYEKAIIDNDEEETKTKQKSAIAYLNFAGLHEPQCKGADNAGGDASDFEIWTPYDGRHGENKCFLGQQVTYVRRKADARCYNGEDVERIVKRTACSCTEFDFECDIGYQRAAGSSTTCMLSAGESLSELAQRVSSKKRKADQCSRYGYFEETRGYRKVPGNICSGGTDLGPISTKCTGGFMGYEWSTIAMVIVGLALIYYGWEYIEAILVLLPIPDPQNLLGWFKSFCEKITGVFKRGVNAPKLPPGKDHPVSEMKGYSGNFDAAPVAMNEEEDDDEEDIGRARNQQQDINYDSDEDKLEISGGPGPEEELISFNSSAQTTAAPRLRGPKR